jgi:hypothetical protein
VLIIVICWPKVKEITQNNEELASELSVYNYMSPKPFTEMFPAYLIAHRLCESFRLLPWGRFADKKFALLGFLPQFQKSIYFQPLAR